MQECNVFTGRVLSRKEGVSIVQSPFQGVMYTYGGWYTQAVGYTHRVGCTGGKVCRGGRVYLGVGHSPQGLDARAAVGTHPTGMLAWFLV